MFHGILIKELIPLQKINQIFKQTNKRDMDQTCSSSIKYNEQLLLDEEQLQQYAARYEGKLLLEEEYYLPANLFTSLVTGKIISPIPSITSSFFTTTCQRCHQSESQYFATIHCARCEQPHLYCRKCIHMGRVMECTPLYEWIGPPMNWLKYRTPCSWQGELTKAQQHAANRMVEAFEARRSLLIWAVTGSGKTEMLFPTITAALKAGKRICIASPRADVVRELVPRLQVAFSSIPIQGLYGGSRDNDGTAQLLVSTTHQLLRFKHAFDLLVIDEVDAFPYHQDQTLQFAAQRARKKISSLVYLTATPREKQRQQMAMKQLDYVFVPVRFHRHHLPVPKFVYCAKLQNRLISDELPQEFIYWLHTRKKPSRQLLVFASTITLANKLTGVLQTLFQHDHALKQLQYNITSVHAGDKEREEKVAAFRRRDYHVLITTTILERGVTFPSVDVAVLDASHDVFDEAALVQIAGRAGRSKEDPTGEVVFFHDGKTNSMVKAQADIVKMNRRATEMMLGEDEV